MIGVTKEIFSEAVCIVAADLMLSPSFVRDTFTEEKIIRSAKCINRKRESKMDSIREDW